MARGRVGSYLASASMDHSVKLWRRDILQGSDSAPIAAVSIRQSSLPEDIDRTNAAGSSATIPNAIAQGIESRGIRAHVTITDNEVRTMGSAIRLTNHRGRVEIRNNAVWTARDGIGVGSDERATNYIAGNRITVEYQDLGIYPNFVRSYVDRPGSACIRIGHTSAGITAGFFLQEVIGLAAHFRIEDNVLAGNPHCGISLLDSPTPETFGPSTPNRSHSNVLTRNDFTQLRSSQYDLALGASTYDNHIHDNVGLRKVFKEAGDQDRNQVSY